MPVRVGLTLLESHHLCEAHNQLAKQVSTGKLIGNLCIAMQVVSIFISMYANTICPPVKNMNRLPAVNKLGLHNWKWSSVTKFIEEMVADSNIEERL